MSLRVLQVIILINLEKKRKKDSLKKNHPFLFVVILTLKDPGMLW